METETQNQLQDTAGEEVMIEADALVKTYGKGEKAVRALDGLSFRARRGTIFALLGPNGAGKSTAVKVLTTLTRPDEGKAAVAGTDVMGSPDRVRRTIGVVSQGTGVDIQATGRENLRLQGQLYGMRGRVLEQRATDLLELFGLADAADRIARGYSGGMRRRLDIAMALVHDPWVLFLDEPTTGLDPEVRADMWEQIAALAAEQDKTVLLTTHYLEEADQLAARVAIVDRGKVVAEGTPEELKSELRGDAVYVELDEPAADGAVRPALEPIAGVREVVVDGRALRARAEDGGRAVPSVLQALEARGIAVSSVRVARPSLDDVYLRYAGRTFQEAESEDTEVKK
ncbi:MAG TPA: ATP-binding cassette domain-containing protein [Solirubrobacteraceae bacterium]|nr:ATP-binding cassette domain-containing protein [Solirubrobacteraceae bacterium]